jgi:hypothetical protein
MADDVFQDAARHPPDPNTNDSSDNNNKKEQETKDNKMEGNQDQNQRNTVTRKFYTDSGTIYGTPNHNSNNSYTTSGKTATNPSNRPNPSLWI